MPTEHPNRWIDLAALPPVPWRNRAGSTRELAVEPPGASLDDFDWRLSIARIDAAGPFSAYAGVDRVITLLDGAGVVLQRAGGAPPHRLDRRWEPFAFDGDTPLDATPIDGPCEDFNLMTRRGRWRGSVAVLRQPTALPASDAALLWPLAGDWQAGTLALTPGRAALWRDGFPPLTLQPLLQPVDAGRALLHIALHRITSAQ